MHNQYTPSEYRRLSYISDNTETTFSKVMKYSIFCSIFMFLKLQVVVFYIIASASNISTLYNTILFSTIYGLETIFSV